MENRDFKIAGIRNLMRTNYGLSGDEVDLHALVDDGLSMSENWLLVKKKVLLLCPKRHKNMW